MKNFRLVYVFCVDSIGNWQHVEGTPEFGNRARAYRFFADNPELFENHDKVILMRKEVSFFMEKRVK